MALRPCPECGYKISENYLSHCPKCGWAGYVLPPSLPGLLASVFQLVAIIAMIRWLFWGHGCAGPQTAAESPAPAPPSDQSPP